ncbi:hypothetical protein [Shimia sp.]|uniref:hypothetical protein n=1 Tax=Shimia sp. TaxID=1954381 RepID=UPI003298073E
MHPALKTRRRIMAHASVIYVRADHDLHRALDDARQFVPDVTDHNIWRIGQPGSRIRRLYEERHRALERLQVARLKLQMARDRLIARSNASQHV